MILSVEIEKETTEYEIYKIEKTVPFYKRIFGVKNIFERYKRSKNWVYTYWDHIYYKEDGRQMHAWDNEVKFIENWRRKF